MTMNVFFLMVHPVFFMSLIVNNQLAKPCQVQIDFPWTLLPSLPGARKSHAELYALTVPNLTKVFSPSVSSLYDDDERNHSNPIPISRDAEGIVTESRFSLYSSVAGGAGPCAACTESGISSAALTIVVPLISASG